MPTADRHDTLSAPRQFMRHFAMGLCLFVAVLLVAPSVRAQTPLPTSAFSITPPINANVCSVAHQMAFNSGRQLSLANQLAKDEQFMRYKVSATYAANCIHQFIDYIKKVDSAVSNILTIAGSTSVVAAAVTLLATEIVSAALEQIIEAINNQVCSITNEAMGAIDSVMRNAICLPTIGGGLGRIGFNINMDLGRSSCSGWALNPVGLIDELSGRATTDAYGNTSFEAPLVTGTPIRGLGGVNYASSLPPSFREDMSGLPPMFSMGVPQDAGDEGYFDYVEGEFDIGGANGEVAGMDLTNVQPGNSRLNIAAAVRALIANARAKSRHLCATYVRLALEAGGIFVRTNYAKDYGPLLLGKGFSVVATSGSGGYVPQAGDIVVEQPYPGGHIAGHIQMYSGTAWYSDYGPTDIYGGPGYRRNNNYIVYRP